MPIPGPGGPCVHHVPSLQTVARWTDSRNKSMITFAAVLTCVINGDSLTSVLHETTWLVVAVTILVIVRVVAAISGRTVKLIG